MAISIIADFLRYPRIPAMPRASYGSSVESLEDTTHTTPRSSLRVRPRMDMMATHRCDFACAGSTWLLGVPLASLVLRLNNVGFAPTWDDGCWAAG